MGHQTLFDRDVAAKAQPSLHSLLSEAVYTKVAVDWRHFFKYCTLSAAFHIHGTLALPANQCLDGSLTDSQWPRNCLLGAKLRQS